MTLIQACIPSLISLLRRQLPPEGEANTATVLLVLFPHSLTANTKANHPTQTEAPAPEQLRSGRFDYLFLSVGR